KLRPQHCDEFVGVFPVVCCPKKKSEIKCLTYYKQRDFLLFVVGGQQSLVKEFPHMAALGYGDKDNIQWSCGGTLISEQFVLTAAHCISSKELGTVKWVRLGDLDLKNTTDEAMPQNFIISEIIVHPEYKAPSHYHDIALLKLDREAKYDDYVQPACLPVKDSVPDELTVTGWGKVDFLGESSSHLLKANLNKVDHNTCKARYSSISKTRLAKGVVDSIQLCAGHPEGKDTCPGDSGGPLQYKTFGRPPYFIVAGVTSFGKGCGYKNSVGVYVRVSYYVRWIEDIVWPE
ncbi:serine protease snake-like, partial [Asbolus verrucosus]